MKAMRVERSGRWMGGLCVLAASLWLAGCASGVSLDDNKPAPVESRTPTKVGPGGGGSASGTSQSQVASVDLTKSSGSVASSLANVIYFDFDSYVVKDEFRSTVEAHAKALAADRKKHLSIEGHTDERGGREYNLALGQKRAESVVKSLALFGASDSQLEAVSFGKERPAAQGSDEAAWAKNRRAELVYH
ncbi:peptidoglycan-associated lipoprotein Pal [Piscinibacter sp.]|uniref:peptidoglycan-associated lipoprotein Pal n=1 Tax=Piscinibacter sp. TaxID=1903157 RepID=UPI0035595C30